MKIGIICGEFTKNYAPEEYFPALREIGFEAVDYGVCENYGKIPEIFTKPREEWTAFFARQAAAARNAGVDICQTHATYHTNFDNQPFLSDYCFEHLCKEIEATAILGSKYIVIHPINLAVNENRWDENYKVNFEAFSRFEPVLRQYDVKLGVEDMFIWDGARCRSTRTGCSLPEDMIMLIDDLNEKLSSDRFVACLDTGHMLIHSVNPATAMRKLGQRTKLLHVHDNYGISDNHLVPGFGITDWNDFAAAMKEVDYNGVFSLETNISAPHRKLGKQALWDYARYCYTASRAILDKAGL